MQGQACLQTDPGGQLLGACAAPPGAACSCGHPDRGSVFSPGRPRKPDYKRSSFSAAVDTSVPEKELLRRGRGNAQMLALLSVFKSPSLFTVRVLNAFGKTNMQRPALGVSPGPGCLGAMGSSMGPAHGLSCSCWVRVRTVTRKCVPPSSAGSRPCWTLTSTRSPDSSDRICAGHSPTPR